MGRRNRNSQIVIEEPAVNLTPLIDVVFVILIMFILIAPLLEIDRIELADASTAPIESTTTVQEPSPISIQVSQDNTIWVNKNKLSIAQLRDYLKEAKKRHPDIKPQVFHDKRAQFGTYQAVKNEVEAAGFQQMEIILKPS